MMGRRIQHILMGLMGAFAFGPALAEDAHPGAQVFQRCAACHLADGAGVPGAFPPLREDVVKLSETESGRNYLAYVALKGVSGEINVGGYTYNSMMPSVTAGLSDEQISDLLNYLVTVVASDNSAGAADGSGEGDRQANLFSPVEIKERRQFAVDGHAQQTILDLRNNALEASASSQEPPEAEQ